MSDSADSGDVSRAYDRWAPTYDDDANATRDLDAVVLRDFGLNVTDGEVLELGCGTGKNTVWLAESARRVVAMDFSSGMLDAARRRVASPRVEFVRQDIRERWPVGDASFDVVVGNLVLEHVADVRPVFDEAHRVLRPGGRLYLAELHPYRQLRGGQAHFHDDDSGDTVYVAAHVHSVSDYLNAGIAAGLSLVSVRESIEPHASPGSLPRLLSLEFVSGPAARAKPESN